VLNVIVGGVLSFLISYFFLAVYLDVDAAIAGIVAAICSIAAMVVVTIWSRR
jgi:uncharacterized membrane protein (GlpM family)